MNRIKTFAATATMLTITGIAQAQLYGIEWTSRNLYRINALTGAKALVGAVPTGGLDPAGLEFHPNGSLYLTSTAAAAQLLTVNPATAASAVVGPIGTAFIAEGALVFAPDGVGFGTEDISGAFRRLVRINPATGAGAIVGNLGAFDINGMMWRSDNKIVGMDSLAANQLVTIDPATAITTPMSGLAFPVGTTGGMASRPNRHSGWFVTGNSGTNALYSFNAYTGNTRFIGPIGFGIGLGAAGLAFEGPSQLDLLGSDFDTGEIYRVSTTTGGRTLIGSSGVANLGGFELAPDGTLYAIGAGGAPNLYKINPANGAATLVGPLGIGFVFEGGLAFEQNSTAYAVNQNNSAAAFLFRINLVTGAAVLVGNMGARDINGLMMRSDGTLVGMDRITNSLVTINKVTGAITGAFAMPFAIGNLGGMTADAWHFNCWYGTGIGGGGTNTLYKINCYTGAVTLVGPMGFVGSGLSGLAITPRFFSGTMHFQSLDPGATPPTEVKVDIRIPETLFHLWSKSVSLTATGAYLTTAPEIPGEYDYSIKHTHWLRRTRTGDSTFGSVSGVNWSFINGDADPDNEVNIVDNAVVAAAFGSMPGDPTWNPMADLDEDNEITIVDTGIIAANFGIAGDD